MACLLVWFLVLSLIALWSLAAWAAHAVTVWTLSAAGSLASPTAGALPEWLSVWMPPEAVQIATQWMTGLASLLDNLLQFAPALAGSVTTAVWIVWGMGSVMLVTLGGGLHLLVALWRKRGQGVERRGSLATLTAG